MLRFRRKSLTESRPEREGRCSLGCIYSKWRRNGDHLESVQRSLRHEIEAEDALSEFGNNINTRLGFYDSGKDSGNKVANCKKQKAPP